MKPPMPGPDVPQFSPRPPQPQQSGDRGRDVLLDRAQDIMGSVIAPHGKNSKPIISTGTDESGSSVEPGSKKKEAREVQIEMVVRRVFNLDTVTQSFGVQLLILMTWPLTEQDFKEGKPPPSEDDDGNWEPPWKPCYRIKAVLEEMAQEKYFRTKEIDGRRYAIQEAHHRVSIYERLELELFPRDCQELTIELESTMTTNQVMWIPSRNETCVQLHKDRCYLDDFELIDDFPFTWSFGILNNHHKEVPGLKVILHVVRNAHFYMINVLFVTFVLCSLVLTTWSMNPSDLEARLTLDFTLVLTVIAFKLILLGMLPRVSYMTMLDKYVMAGFLFLICATMCHAILPMFFFDRGDISELTREPESFDNEGSLLDCDTISFYVFAGVWAIFNIAWGLNFRMVGNREYEKFVRRAMKQQEGFDNNHRNILKTASMKFGLAAMERTSVRSDRSRDSEGKGRSSHSNGMASVLSWLFTPPASPSQSK